MFPGDPVSSSTFDQFQDLSTTTGYPTSNITTADDIDWTALGCLPGSGNGLSEPPANSLESQSQGFSSVDSPELPFDHNQPTITTTAPSTTHTATSTPTTHSTHSSQMPSATSTLPTPSPASRESSPKENPSRISKRQLNTMAARRYRQRRLDRMTQLEEELEAIKRERDELKMRVSKLEGETEALRSMAKEKS
ncbi:bZIP transcription factor JlbA/IDI-4 [Aspergillus puulaauensis]|uniref:BZIP domain-containing protein n=1 Tax=Aspergillus puulaauensis TaxID=1220207 RepID=A0A7R7XGG8_9EURO|nr:uncharacterized protein APUU_21282S [Aspergillus puulaauensis]BCS20850.1 hypothetical protein APUU_21282S [Aspergillus puulaauensis]